MVEPVILQWVSAAVFRLAVRTMPETDDIFVQTKRSCTFDFIPEPESEEVRVTLSPQHRNAEGEEISHRR